MAKPRIIFNSRTIDFSLYPWTLPDEAPRGLQESKTVSGIVESMNSRQDVAGRISLRNFRNSDPTDAALKRNLKQWLSWAQKGLPWYLAFDSGEMVLTTMASAPAAGATSFDVAAPTSIATYFSAVMADLPSLYLRLNEPSGTSAIDYSGNALTGTYQNTPTLGVAGPIGPTAVTLNGTTQYISRADNALLDPGDTLSAEAWIKLAALPAFPPDVYSCIIGKGANSYRFGVLFNTGNLFIGKDGIAVIAQSTAGVSLNTWTHVAFTKTGSAVHLYINGVEVTGSIANQTIAANASAVGIGASSGGADSFFSGSLAEVALYPTALSAARILAHYQAGLPQFGLCVVRSKEDVDLVKVTNVVGSAVTIADPLNFAYAIGDRFRSERYWPARLVDGKNPFIERPPGFWDFELPFMEDVNNL